MKKSNYEEALELLNNGCDGPDAFEIYKTALEKAQKQEKLLGLYRELVERDTPKKVCYDNVGRSECPSCDRNYLFNGRMNRNKYCGYCGQRLDWRE